MKPRIMTRDELSACSMFEFKHHHSFGLGINISWKQVFGDRWYKESNEENYLNYEQWYIKNYTKLGNILFGEMVNEPDE